MFDVTFSLKRSLHKPRKINETITPYLLSVMRYGSSSEKERRTFFQKHSSITGRKTKASFLMTEAFLAKKKPTSMLFFSKENGFCIFYQF